jgi:integral membrane protein (TIGR00529 family)
VIRDIRVLFVSLPALIGLLPMPGGAVFSAPMVDTAASQLPISRIKKSIMNYWFRHIWEYCCPLYPGMVLAAQLAEVRIQKLMLYQCPLTLVALGVGIVVLLGKRYARVTETSRLDRPKLAAILLDISPIISVVLLILLFGIPLIIALAASIVLTLARNRVHPRKFSPMLLKCKRVPAMALMIFGIMIFKGMLNDSGAIGQIVTFLQEYQVPLPVMVMVLPFLVGMVTGITVGYVGITFPVIIPLAGPGNPQLLAYLVMAFGFGFMGVMLSPVHLCMIISHEYFKAPLGEGYRYLAPMAGLTLAATAGLFALYL